VRDLNGKTAFITGGASGIGLGMATAFAREGMNIAITDIQKDQLAIAERELRTITDNVLALEVDSTDKRSLENAADELVLEPPEEKWRRIHEVNFWGPLNGINLFLPRMLEHGEEGHIVNTSSFSGIQGHSHQSGYGTSKFALVGLSEFLRNDLADSNIGVSVLCPHVVDTPIIDNLKKKVPEDIRQMIEDMAVAAETVGAQVIHAILNQEFYIFCDGTHTRGMLEQRCRDLISAMDRQFPRSTDD
jgi:NAD(P)-dependent dehydrogenase (short-subunit alcohol dehydrogenase family)